MNIKNLTQTTELTLKNIVEKIIFNSKWILIPFYLKLFYTLIQLMFVSFKYHIVPTEYIIQTLEDVDVVMIANLVKMIITGSYSSFVDKNHKESNEHVSSGMLKVKMSSSLVGVSSIYLLTKFLTGEELKPAVFVQVITIHGIFLIGAGILAWMDYIHVKSEHMMDQIKDKELEKEIIELKKELEHYKLKAA